MTGTRKAEWLDDYDNIISLANFLVEVKGFDTENLLYFIEKPYKFNDEYKEMKYYHENDIYPYGDNEWKDGIDDGLCKENKKLEEESK